MDKIIAEHAILKIVTNKIIPCSCGGSRLIVQNKESQELSTKCSQCGTQAIFNLADLVFLSTTFIKMAINEDSDTELKRPDISSSEIWKMVEGCEDWTKKIEKQKLRMKLDIIQGGVRS